jgi:translation initiation factor IF-2
MAKVRAYKIAEELGIERNEFVAKAKELGVELRSAMASVEDAEADLLRRKLGETKTVERESRRVETKSGSAVIRRRKKVAAPEPEPTPVVEASEEAAEEEVELTTPGSV